MTARRLLEEAGYSDPNDLKLHLALPQGTWFTIALPPESATGKTEPLEPLEPLHVALIMGLCGVSLYSPLRPVVWSETRLSRKLILIQPSAFYRARP